MTSSDVAPAASMLWFEIALIIFMVVFGLIVAWVCLARGSHFRAAAQIPLHDDTAVSPRDPETDDPSRASQSEANHERA